MLSSIWSNKGGNQEFTWNGCVWILDVLHSPKLSTVWMDSLIHKSLYVSIGVFLHIHFMYAAVLIIAPKKLNKNNPPVDWAGMVKFLVSVICFDRYEEVVYCRE